MVILVRSEKFLSELSMSKSFWPYLKYTSNYSEYMKAGRCSYSVSEAEGTNVSEQFITSKGVHKGGGSATSQYTGINFIMKCFGHA